MPFTSLYLPSARSFSDSRTQHLIETFHAEFNCYGAQCSFSPGEELFYVDAPSERSDEAFSILRRLLADPTMVQEDGESSRRSMAEVPAVLPKDVRDSPSPVSTEETHTRQDEKPSLHFLLSSASPHVFYKFVRLRDQPDNLMYRLLLPKEDIESGLDGRLPLMRVCRAVTYSAVGQGYTVHARVAAPQPSFAGGSVPNPWSQAIYPTFPSLIAAEDVVADTGVIIAAAETIQTSHDTPAIDRTAQWVSETPGAGGDASQAADSLQSTRAEEDGNSQTVRTLDLANDPVYLSLFGPPSEAGDEQSSLVTAEERPDDRGPRSTALSAHSRRQAIEASTISGNSDAASYAETTRIPVPSSSARSLPHRDTPLNTKAWECKVVPKEVPLGQLVDVDHPFSDQPIHGPSLESFPLLRPNRRPTPASTSRGLDIGQVEEEAQGGEKVVERLALPVKNKGTRLYRTTRHQAKKGGPSKKNHQPAGQSSGRPVVESNTGLPLPSWVPPKAGGQDAAHQKPVSNARETQPSQQQSQASPKDLRLIHRSPTSTKQLVVQSIVDILSKAGLGGQVEWRIQIGRIVMDALPLERKSENQALDMRSMSEKLAKPTFVGRASTHFSALLSRSLDDSLFMINLRSHSGQRLFATDPLQVAVNYELYCSFENRPLRVSVSSGRRVSVSSKPDSIGKTYLHHPTRVHDARFHAQTRLSVEIPKALSTLIDTLEATTSDLDGHIVPELRFVVPSIALRVEQIIMHRTLLYDSTATPALAALEVVETTDLEWSYNDRTQIFRAKPNMADTARLWYEASVVPKPDSGSSSAADTTKVVAQMVDLTTAVVERIDAVGKNNQGPRGDADDMDRIRRNEDDRDQWIVEATEYLW